MYRRLQDVARPAVAAKHFVNVTRSKWRRHTAVEKKKNRVCIIKLYFVIYACINTWCAELRVRE